MSLAACSGTASDTDSKANETTVENTFTPDPLVEQAIDSVKKEWIKQYDKNSISDRYLEIKNTRVITIKDNESEYFKDIDKIRTMTLILKSEEYKTIVSKSCIGCGLCVDLCVMKAIKLDSLKAKIEADLCCGCLICEEECPTRSIRILEVNK